MNKKFSVVMSVYKNDKPEFLGAAIDSLLNQTDIVPVLKGLKMVNHPSEGLVVTNPPILRSNKSEE